MAQSGLTKLLGAISERLTRGDVKESEINAIRETIMPDVDVDTFKLMYKRYSHLLRNISSSDMGDAQLDAYLTSMVKKKDSGLRFEDAWTLGEWWKKEKSAVRLRLEQATLWEQQLVSSRAKIRATVPVGGDGGDARGLAERRVAVLELGLANPERTLEFEVPAPGVEALLRELRAVDAEIRRCCDPELS